MRPARLLRRWGAEEGGATAVEFALIGPLFLLLITGCIDFGLQYMTQLDLDNATELAARQVAIGAISSQSAFRTQVCTNASVLLSNCANALQVEVQSASTFAGLTPASVQGNGTLSASGFSGGTSGSSVLVQAAFTRPYDVAWLTAMFGSTPTLLSTVAVQNEPAAAS
jgi:Flp pilus assembly protein TadG